MVRKIVTKNAIKHEKRGPPSPDFLSTPSTPLKRIWPRPPPLLDFQLLYIYESEGNLKHGKESKILIISFREKLSPVLFERFLRLLRGFNNLKKLSLDLLDTDSDQVTRSVL